MYTIAYLGLVRSIKEVLIGVKTGFLGDFSDVLGFHRLGDVNVRRSRS